MKIKRKAGVNETVKRAAVFLALCALTVSSLAGCGKKDSAESRIDKDGIMELTYYNMDSNRDDPWTDPVALAITKATGIKLKTSIPVSDGAEDIALMIAAQSYPDLIYAKGSVVNLVEAGALIDMTDLIEEYGPNIKKMYGEELKKLQYSAEDPAIYQLSSYAVGGQAMTTSGTMQLQWKVLEENGYRYPTTLEEYEAMVKAYLNEHPETEDGQKTIGMTLSTSDWRWMITLGNPSGFVAEGSPDNGEWLIDENDNAVFKYRSPKIKEYYRWLCRMYDEGVLDSEFATQTHQDYIAKLASGRVLGITDNAWDYAEAETILKADGKVDKTYAGLPVTMDADTKCASLMYQGLTTGWGIAISVDCPDPVAAIKFIDYLCSDEGMILRLWGIEGENYFVDENGMRYRTPEEIEWSKTDQDYAEKTGVGFHTNGFPNYGDGEKDSTGNTYTVNSEDVVISGYNEAEKKACEAMGIRMLTDIFPQPEEFETPAYSSPATYVMSAEFGKKFSIMSEVAWPGLVKAVQGGQDAFDQNYDAMLKEMEANGMSDLEQEMSAKVKESAAWKER